MHTHRVMDGGEAAVETAIMKFTPLRCLKVVYQILLAFVPHYVDKGIGEFRMLIKNLEVWSFREGEMDGEETVVGIFPLIQTGYQFRFEMFLAHIIIEGLMRI
jgi:hypothetical protein